MAGLRDLAGLAVGWGGEEEVTPYSGIRRWSERKTKSTAGRMALQALLDPFAAPLALGSVMTAGALRFGPKFVNQLLRRGLASDVIPRNLAEGLRPAYRMAETSAEELAGLRGGIAESLGRGRQSAEATREFAAAEGTLRGELAGGVDPVTAQNQFQERAGPLRPFMRRAGAARSVGPPQANLASEISGLQADQARMLRTPRGTPVATDDPAQRLVDELSGPLSPELAATTEAAGPGVHPLARNLGLTSQITKEPGGPSTSHPLGLGEALKLGEAVGYPAGTNPELPNMPVSWLARATNAMGLTDINQTVLSPGLRQEAFSQAGRGVGVVNIPKEHVLDATNPEQLVILRKAQAEAEKRVSQQGKPPAGATTQADTPDVNELLAKLPPLPPGSPPRYVTMVGATETPPEFLPKITSLAAELEKRGYIVRSGGAKGADTAAERGVVDPKKKLIYRPEHIKTLPTGAKARQMARELLGEQHWGNLKSEYVENLHSRNMMQVLGEDLNTPSDYVIAWTKAGMDVGGTATALKLARKHGVPIFNFGGVPKAAGAAPTPTPAAYRGRAPQVAANAGELGSVVTGGETIPQPGAYTAGDMQTAINILSNKKLSMEQVADQLAKMPGSALRNITQNAPEDLQVALKGASRRERLPSVTAAAPAPAAAAAETAAEETGKKVVWLSDSRKKSLRAGRGKLATYAEAAELTEKGYFSHIDKALTTSSLRDLPTQQAKQIESVLNERLAPIGATTESALPIEGGLAGMLDIGSQSPEALASAREFAGASPLQRLLEGTAEFNEGRWAGGREAALTREDAWAVAQQKVQDAARRAGLMRSFKAKRAYRGPGARGEAGAASTTVIKVSDERLYNLFSHLRDAPPEFVDKVVAHIRDTKSPELAAQVRLVAEGKLRAPQAASKAVPELAKFWGDPGIPTYTTRKNPWKKKQPVTIPFAERKVEPITDFLMKPIGYKTDVTKMLARNRFQAANAFTKMLRERTAGEARKQAEIAALYRKSLAEILQTYGFTGVQSGDRLYTFGEGEGTLLAPNIGLDETMGRKLSLAALMGVPASGARQAYKVRRELEERR